jgi:hypothetical protein
MAILEETGKSELQARFESWVGDGFDLRVALWPEHGQWFALAMDFDITGQGITRQAAVHQMGQLLGAYLVAYFEEGASFSDALRPVPLPMRAKIRAESLLLSVLRSLDGRFELARERQYFLPTPEIYARC